MIGFWIFMLIMNLLIPATMTGFGSLFSKTPPKEINFIFGYRTPMSMKNKETWIFAHNYCGRIWRIFGIIIFILSVTAMIFLFGEGIGTVGIFGGIICGIQVIFMIIPIFITEKALNKNFDKEGNRK